MVIPDWPIDLLLRYADEQATWRNFPVPAVWVSFWNSASPIFDQTQSDRQSRQMFHGVMIRA